MVKRAWIYLRRKNKRSIILLVLLFVISCSISIGLSVWNSISDAIKEVEQRMGTSIVLKLSQATIQDESYRVDLLDPDGEDTFGYGGPSVTDNMIQQILEEVDGISHYNADNDAYCHVDDLILVPGFWTRVRDEYQKEPDLVVDKPGAKEKRIMYAQCTFAFGNTDSSLDSRFRTGAFELVEGRHLTSEKDHGKVLISDELAKLNGLEIGDTFDISVRSGFIKSEPRLKRWGETIELEIIGIFHVNGYQPTGDWVFEDEMTYNYIFTDIDTVKHLYGSMFAADCENLPELRYSNVIFFVEDPTRLPDILDQIQNLQCIETQYYDITFDDTMYKSTTEALSNISNIVMTLVAVIVTGCAVVLLIVFTMWVRSRKQEISIYLSLGLSKASIFGQFVLEAAIVAVLAGALAFGVCHEVPNMIGNYMLTDAIEDAQPEITEPTREEIHQAAQAGTMSELFQYESGDYAGPEQIDFTFHISDFFVMLLLELLIIVAAILKGGWFIFSMQPRKIMTDLR